MVAVPLVRISGGWGALNSKKGECSARFDWIWSLRGVVAVPLVCISGPGDRVPQKRGNEAKKSGLGARPKINYWHWLSIIDFLRGFCPLTGEGDKVIGNFCPKM